MKALLRAIVYVLLAIYNGIQVVTGGASLKKLVPTGVINQGILGGFSGKVGPVVGGKWKDIDYMRGYVVPENPNTPAQQAVRAKWKQLVVTARTLLTTILQPFWDIFYPGMSGFNAWISQNYSLSDSDGKIDQTAIMSKGTLEGTVITDCEYDTATGATTLGFDTTINGNGLTTDNVNYIFYDISTDIAYFSIDETTRGGIQSGPTLPTGLNAANLFCWIMLYRGSGAELIVSDSDGSIVAAA